jgi:Fur family ferric uptake transcriptional regulator
MGSIGSHETAPYVSWTDVRDQLRARGLRWTPQRRTLIDVLSKTDGHVTGADLVDRCREIEPTTTPTTVYRTRDVREVHRQLSHSPGASGREEFHIRPVAAHGHQHCIGCGTTWEIGSDEAATLVDTLQRERAFAVDLSHLSIAGRCAGCGGEVDG